MFDIGPWELIITAALMIILVKPTDLPKLFRTLGKWYREIRSIGDGFKNLVNQEYLSSSGSETPTGPSGEAEKPPSSQAEEEGGNIGDGP